MATLHALEPMPEAAEDDVITHLGCQSDVEREVLTILRRLDEEEQVGALLILQAVERRAKRARGPRLAR